MLLFQSGMLLSFMLVCACLSYLIHRRWTAIRYGRRFSLLDSLVVITFFAALGGLVFGLTTDDSLPRHMRFNDFVREWQEAQPDQEQFPT